MSWSSSVSKVSRSELQAALEAALVLGNDDVPTERQEQVDAARAAALYIARSAAVGDGAFNVSINGHANPEHKPRDGWSNDYVNVTINQVKS